jgi:hypothetical protein
VAFNFTVRPYSLDGIEERWRAAQGDASDVETTR